MNINTCLICPKCGKICFLKNNEEKFFICDVCEVGYEIEFEDNKYTITKEFEDYIIVNDKIYRNKNVINFFNGLFEK